MIFFFSSYSSPFVFFIYSLRFQLRFVSDSYSLFNSGIKEDGIISVDFSAIPSEFGAIKTLNRKSQRQPKDTILSFLLLKVLHKNLHIKKATAKDSPLYMALF